MRFRHALLFLLLSSPSLAKTKPAKRPANQEPTSTTAQVDSVLDRLEKQLIEQDREGLTFSPKSSGDVNKTSNLFRFERKGITGTDEDSARLRETAQSIAEIENQVDALTQDVQRLRQSAFEEARLDNTLDLSLKVENPDAITIRQLDVKIDGFALYSINEAAGLWIPSNQFPLFSGPIDTGHHRIEIEAKLVQKILGGLPLNGDTVTSMQSTFDVTVAKSKPKLNYHLVVHPPKNGKDGSIELRDFNPTTR